MKGGFTLHERTVGGLRTVQLVLRHRYSERTRTAVRWLFLTIARFQNVAIRETSIRLLPRRRWRETARVLLSDAFALRQIKSSIDRLSTPPILLAGPPRSGTSFLQSLLITYFPKSSLADYRRSPLHQLKHTLPMFVELVAELGRDVRVLVPVRDPVDALTSWAIYDPSILSTDALQECLNYYSQFFAWAVDAPDVVKIVDFLDLTAEPDSIAAGVSSALGIESVRSRGLSAENVFRAAVVGDSTGLGAEASLGNAAKSHMPSAFKNSVQPFYRDLVETLLDEHALERARADRDTLLRSKRCVRVNHYSSNSRSYNLGKS